MSKDREPRYFDFIHQHEERLNLIYSRWEAQIAQQNAANRSESLFSKIDKKKTAACGMAIAFGSVLAAWQCGTNKLAAWQNQRQVGAMRNLIAANSRELNQIAQELNNSAAYNNRLLCVQSGDIYELALGTLYDDNIANQPQAFLSQPDTVSLVRTSIVTQRPDAYLRLNPDRNLLYGSIEDLGNEVRSESYLVDLDRELADLPVESEEMNRYAEVQSGAIALHEELSSCLGDLSLMPEIPQFPYAD